MLVIMKHSYLRRGDFLQQIDPQARASFCYFRPTCAYPFLALSLPLVPVSLVLSRVGERSERLRETAGGLYIRAAMQFVRLPLNTDPRKSLKSSIELTKVIEKVPGMIRFGPV